MAAKTRSLSSAVNGLRRRSIFSKAARLISNRAASWTRPNRADFLSVAKGCWTVVGRDINAPYRVLSWVQIDLPMPTGRRYCWRMDGTEPKVLILPRISATRARPSWVPLLNQVEAQGVALEVTRRQRRSVVLVRAFDFEQHLGRSHPWSGLRARISPHSFHPNGLKPGVTHRWTYASSTWIRDHFCSVMEWVDAANQPLLVTRRGKCGLMLLAQPLFETYWTTSPLTDEPGSEIRTGKNLAKDPVMSRVARAGIGLNLAHEPLHSQAPHTSTKTH